jgi:hypothetical protein
LTNSDKVSMAGPLDAFGTVEGSLLPNQEPAVNMNWTTTNNTLQTHVASFSQCSFAGNFMNSVHKDSAHNDNNSRITFHHFAGNWDGIHLSGKDITITNLLQPQLHFAFHSDCKLATLDDKFALKNIMFKKGDVNLDLFYDGPITKDKSMLEELEGRLDIKNGEVEYVPHNFTFANCNGVVGFFKDSISMRRFSCQYKENKLDIEVEGKNIRRKFVVNDVSQEAAVKCYIRTSYLNLNDFKPLFSHKNQRAKPKKAHPGFAATADKLDGVLDNSIIAVQVNAKEVKQGNMDAKNFEADIKFHPHHWELARISLQVADGLLVTNGQVIKNANGNHDASITVKVEHTDMKKLLYAFDNFGQDAVTHQHLEGKFSTNTSLKAGIDHSGKIIPASINGFVDFSLKDGALKKFPPMAHMKKFVFKHRDMDDIRFAEIKDKIEIKGNDIFFNRMEIESSVFRLFIEGNYALDGKNTDMLIQVPLSNLNSENFIDDVAPKNVGTTTKVGMSVWLRAANDDDGKVKLKLTLNKHLKNKKGAVAKT